VRLKFCFLKTKIYLLMKPGILVVGSSNTDMVIKSGHLPAPGETILGGEFFMNPGGKGANQAVAAARLGGDVTFICKTGNDIFGRQAVELFKEEGIDTRYMLSDPENPSGVALITVDAKGENTIVVASGANATLTSSDLLDALPLIKQSGLVLMQLEIPVSTVKFVAAAAFSTGAKVILNPAPACSLPDVLLAVVYLVTPNETEAEILSGIKVTDIETARLAAKVLKEKGAENIIITLGANGALVFADDVFSLINAPKVKAVDTTAAGDVFNGALAVALADGKTITEAAEFACRAASISVTRFGAQASAPYKHELS
jgi:ribokinase